jgi:hypothetical protein
MEFLAVEVIHVSQLGFIAVAVTPDLPAFPPGSAQLVHVTRPDGSSIETSAIVSTDGAHLSSPSFSDSPGLRQQTFLLVLKSSSLRERWLMANNSYMDSSVNQDVAGLI